MRPNTIHHNDCGNCKHWHEWPKEKQRWSLHLGTCDKIAKGTVFDGSTYDGYSFEDECYDEDFNCFEPLEDDE